MSRFDEKNEEEAEVKKNNLFCWEHDAFNNNYMDMGTTGYTGWDPHTVTLNTIMPAWRAQVGTRGFYKAGLVVLPDGTLIASPVNMLAPKVRSPFSTGCVDDTWPVILHRSTDGGHSWQLMEHSPLWGKEGSLHYLNSGVMLFTSESIDGVGISEDLGYTWRFVSFADDKRNKYEVSAAMRAPIMHKDGTLSFMRCIGTPEGFATEGYKPSNCRAWLIHSSDGGRTWKERSNVSIPWEDPFPFFIEADFVRLPDGRILASSRFEWNAPLKGKQLPYPPGAMRNDHAAGHMVLMESSDDGYTWSEPREFLQYSEVQGQLTLLHDGRLLCTYTHYHLPFGVAAVVSYDSGRTWDHTHPIQLALSNGGCTGWATTRELPDGALVTIHALEPYHIEPPSSGRTVCHSVRWQLPLLNAV